MSNRQQEQFYNWFSGIMSEKGIHPDDWIIEEENYKEEWLNGNK